MRFWRSAASVKLTVPIEVNGRTIKRVFLTNDPRKKVDQLATSIGASKMDAATIIISALSGLSHATVEEMVPEDYQACWSIAIQRLEYWQAKRMGF